MKLVTLAVTARRVLICMIIAIAGLFGHLGTCAQADEILMIEVIVMATEESRLVMQVTFPEVPLIFRDEVDCPDMEVAKVQASTEIESMHLWEGIRTLNNRTVLYTQDGREFDDISGNLRLPKDPVAWFSLTFLELCARLQDGIFLVSDGQHYTEFE